MFAEVNAPSAKGSPVPLWEEWDSQEDVFPSLDLGPEQSAKAEPLLFERTIPSQDGGTGAFGPCGSRVDKRVSIHMNPRFAGYIRRPSPDPSSTATLDSPAGIENWGDHIHFPAGSEAVRAGWLTPPAGPPNMSQYTARPWGESGQVLRLGGLHIMKKGEDGWIFATFESDCVQAHAPGSPVVVSPQGDEPAPPQWLRVSDPRLLHYRLVGVEDSYSVAGANGPKIQLTNRVLEAGRSRPASCMGCHADAVAQNDGSDCGAVGNDAPAYGPPDPRLYNGRINLDGVWSLILGPLTKHPSRPSGHKERDLALAKSNPDNPAPCDIAPSPNSGSQQHSVHR
ncbi:MAG TPA: hypothetical protein VN515_07955 [Terriglobales bacterium]|nr:hypothetical protein [Terriglobales bacterium]